jgi:sRNA-binding protein
MIGSAPSKPSEVLPENVFVESKQRRPLKLSIVKDIEANIAKDQENELRFYDIADAVSWYCSHVGYQVACSVAGAARLDLQGKKAGAVTETEARAAEEEAKNIFGKIEAQLRRHRREILP